MKQVFKISAACLALTLAAPALAHETCPAPGEWFTPGATAPTRARAAIATLAAADVVLLGEHHGDTDIQLWQAVTAAAIAGQRGQVQYGYEMFPRTSQPALDAWSRGETSRHGFLAAAGWADVWGFAANAYDPILRLPRLQKAPAIALNVDRALIRRVGREGWMSVSEADRLGIGDPAAALPEYRTKLGEILGMKASGAAPEFEKRDGDGHGDGKGENPHKPDAAKKSQMAERFIDAQLVWDRAFAEAIAAALKANPGQPVIAFMGRGHVDYGHGVKHQLQDLGVTNVATAIPLDGGEGCHLDADAAGRPLADLVYGLPERHEEPKPAPRPKIGVFIANAEGGGASITRVSADSPAEAAGFMAGDVVSLAAGQPVARAADLGAAIRRHSWGAWLPFSITRNGEAMELLVKLPASPPK